MLINKDYSLFNTCVPRLDALNDKSSNNETLNISTWEKVDVEDFFERNYITEGMHRLAQNVFNRFNGNTNAPSLIKLTQSMGGGKTHNMTMLALLSRYPEYRHLILDDYRGTMTKIKVVVVDGRNDHPHGIWGSIAEQLRKKELFKDFYSPLSTPGTNNWNELLKDSSVLILIDEIPFYLNKSKSKPVGDDNLANVTKNALVELFQAVQQSESTCLVMSTLVGDYESANNDLEEIFGTVENELNRNSLSLAPVDGSSNDIYNILRKQLFKSTVLDEKENRYIVPEIASLYKKKLDEYERAGLPVTNSDSLQIQIQESFPFHPSLKDLYARFKNNEGFQQTRGLIRLMKNAVNNVFCLDKELAQSQMLINCFDFDFSDSDTINEIHRVNSSLTAALAKDIYSVDSTSTLQQLAKEKDNKEIVNIGKLVYMSSLANVASSVIGLTEGELITYLASPSFNMLDIKENLNEIINRCWYLHKNGSTYYFKNQKNLTAEINETINVTSDEVALNTIREELKQRFSPVEKKIYSNLLVFPTLSEIADGIKRDNTSLLIYQPKRNAVPLPEQLKIIYEEIQYKNRVCFLTCDDVKYFEDLIKVAKEKAALESIKKRYSSENHITSNVKIELDNKYDNVLGRLKRRLIECFNLIKYPTRGGELKSVDFEMNEVGGEQEVIDALKRYKLLSLDENTNYDAIRRRIERELFIYNSDEKQTRPTSWNTVKENAAIKTEFYFCEGQILDALKRKFLDDDVWREEDGFIKVGPFKNSTRLGVCENGNKLTLIPQYCISPKIHYTVDGTIPTIKSPVLDSLELTINKDTLSMNFLCVDTSGDNEIGDVTCFKATPKLEVELIHDGIKQFVKAKCSILDMPIFYSLDGTNVENSKLIYSEPIEIPTKGFVLLQARFAGVSTNSLKVEWEDTVVSNNFDGTKKLAIGPKRNLPLTVTRDFIINESFKVAEFLKRLKDVNGTISSVGIQMLKKEGYSTDSMAQIILGGKDYTATEIQSLISNIKDSAMQDISTNNIISFKKIKLNVAADFEKLGLSVSSLSELSRSEWENN